MSKKKPEINMKAFLAEATNAGNEQSEINLEYISETNPIVEWNLIQAFQKGELLSFIVFETADGQEITLPLTNENTPELVNSMIENTPGLNPKLIPSLAYNEKFWKKYKRQVIIFGSLMGLFFAIFGVSAIVKMFTG